MLIESGAMPGEWIVGTGALRPGSRLRADGTRGIPLRDKLEDIAVLSHSKTEARSGVGGAAAGAALGFLVAGPLGTMVGAGIGRGKTKQYESEQYRVLLTVVGRQNIMALVSAHELSKLMTLVQENKESEKAAAPATVVPATLPAAAAKETSDREAADSEGSLPDHIVLELDEETFARISTFVESYDLPTGDQFSDVFNMMTIAVAQEEKFTELEADAICTFILTGDPDYIQPEYYELRRLKTMSPARSQLSFPQKGSASEQLLITKLIRDRVVEAYCRVPNLATNSERALREIAGAELLPRDAVRDILTTAGVYVATE